MIVLSASTFTLQLILSAGTADVDVSYVDRTATAYPIGATEQTAATATTQTICSAPAKSTSREIDFLSVKIKTTGGVVTVQKLNSSGAVVTQLISVTLLDEEVLQYTHGSGWCALDANGNRKEVTSSVFSSITTGTITSTGVQTFSETIAGYEWTAWNPSDLVGTQTNAPSTGTADTSIYATPVNSSGTVTMTFDVAGKYLISILGYSNHGNVYTFSRIIVATGGTASRRFGGNEIMGYGDPAQDSNYTAAGSFLVIATAGQTLTILPSYEVTGSGTTAQHTAYASFTAVFCGN